MPPTVVIPGALVALLLAILLTSYMIYLRVVEVVEHYFVATDA